MMGDRLNLHVALADAINSPCTLGACRAVLSDDERQRAERFVFERHRRQYIVAHGMLRHALSDASPGIAPSDWSFSTGRHGRPFIAAPRTALHFSLSHTEGCVACIVSAHEAAGVDVEELSTRHALMETAQRMFAPEEIETLRGLPQHDFIDQFFDYWTLKEAYLKARGFGLNLPLDGFAMRFVSDGIAIDFKPAIADDPQRWRFTISSPSPAHRLAIADGSGTSGGLPINTHEFRDGSRLAERLA